MTPRTKRGAASAGTAAIVAAVAAAVLQVLQQSIAAFNPRSIVTALIVVAAFFAGLAAARMRSRHAARGVFEARRRHLRMLLGAWPAPHARDADPLRLGVFPSRRDLQEDTPYVKRDLDGPVRAAMGAGEMVLILGEARAGASRTAFEAVRHTLGDAVLLAPRTPNAVVELLRLDPPLQLGDRHVLVWLDGLDRYSGIIDAECLTELDALADRVTVVATIRRAHWEEWLHGSGDLGEAARAVVARARMFELSSPLSPAELAEANAQYPGLNFSAGIGNELASRGRDCAPVAAAPPEPEQEDEPDPTPRAGRDLQLLASSALTLVTLITLGFVLVVSGFSKPSISSQLATIERAGSSGGGEVSVVVAGVDLHGTGVKSWLLLFHDPSGASRSSSDEIRVYDEEGGNLVPALRFRPAGPRAVFQYRAAQDIDFDNATEIVGGYGYADEAREAMVPFAIAWDSATDRYRTVVLDMGAPKLSHPATIVPEQQYLRVYASPVTFADPSDHLAITGHLVQDFAVTPPPRRIVAGLFLRPWLGSQRARFQLESAILDRSRGAPHVTACTLTGHAKPLVLSAGQERALWKVFLEAYAIDTRGRYCESAVFG